MKTCGHDLSKGYGTASDGTPDEGTRYCYSCCAKRDRETMQREGKIVLYLDTVKLQVTNWPGSLTFNVGTIKTGRHNMAGKRYDVWFAADGYDWHGTQYGDNTQLVHCKRIAWK